MIIRQHAIVARYKKVGHVCNEDFFLTDLEVL